MWAALCRRGGNRVFQTCTVNKRGGKWIWESWGVSKKNAPGESALRWRGVLGFPSLVPLLLALPVHLAAVAALCLVYRRVAGYAQRLQVALLVAQPLRLLAGGGGLHRREVVHAVCCAIDTLRLARLAHRMCREVCVAQCPPPRARYQLPIGLVFAHLTQTSSGCGCGSAWCAVGRLSCARAPSRCPRTSGATHRHRG